MTRVTVTRNTLHTVDDSSEEGGYAALLNYITASITNVVVIHMVVIFVAFLFRARSNTLGYEVDTTVLVR